MVKNIEKTQFGIGRFSEDQQNREIVYDNDQKTLIIDRLAR